MNLLINANGGCFFIASETLPPTCRETVSQENWSGAKASAQGVGVVVDADSWSSV